jgi:rhamnosyl/mannosyltransferase
MKRQNHFQNKKIKVLQVNKLYYPHIGGVEKHVQDVSEALVDYTDMTVLAANNTFKTTVEAINGVKVYKVISLGTVASAPITPTFWLWLRRLNPDIYHFHFPYPIGELSYLLTRCNKKLVVTYHSDIIRQKRLLSIYRPFITSFLGKANVILASSPNLIKNSPFISQFASKCRVVPFGIDTNRFKLTSETQKQALELRRRFATKNVVLFIGRLIYYKGLSYLIKAAKTIDGKIVLVGDGDLRSELEKLATSLGIRSKIIFYGRADDKDLPALYHASDLLVLPSIARSEAFGLVQLEAQACGKPVVSTNLSTGVPYANLDGITGIVVPPKDSHALAEAINKLIHNPELRQRLGSQGKKRVQTRFTIKVMAEFILKIYNELQS